MTMTDDITEVSDITNDTLYWVQSSQSDPDGRTEPDRQVLGIRNRDHSTNWMLLYPRGTVGGAQYDAAPTWLSDRYSKAVPLLATHRLWWAAPDSVTVVGPATVGADGKEIPSDGETEVDMLRRQLTDARRETTLAVRALEHFKEQVVEIGGAAAEEHGFCSVYDQIMEDLGLPRRAREMQVTVRCSFYTNVTVVATDEEDAQEKAGDLAVAGTYSWRPGAFFTDAEMSSPWDLDYEVDAE